MRSLKVLDLSMIVDSEVDMLEGLAGAASRTAPAGLHTVKGRASYQQRLSGMLISDSGIQCLTRTMMSGALASLRQLFLHRQPRISTIGIAYLERALLEGACAKLKTVLLQGHTAADYSIHRLTCVLKARRIESDLLPECEEDEEPDDMLPENEPEAMEAARLSMLTLTN
jgi:hypothetical protein